MQKKKLFIISLLMLCATSAMAQITTAALAGVHEPSGTRTAAF